MKILDWLLEKFQNETITREEIGQLRRILISVRDGFFKDFAARDQMAAAIFLRAIEMRGVLAE